MEQTPPKHTGSNISNIEWGLAIGAVGVIDVVQFFLNLFAIGILVNRLINIVVGMTLALYFWMRGVKINKKKIFSFVATFAGEMIPIIDIAPLWTLNVITTMLLDNADKKLSKLPI